MTCRSFFFCQQKFKTLHVLHGGQDLHSARHCTKTGHLNETVQKICLEALGMQEVVHKFVALPFQFFFVGMSIASLRRYDDQVRVVVSQSCSYGLILEIWKNEKLKKKKEKKKRKKRRTLTEGQVIHER